VTGPGAAVHDGNHLDEIVFGPPAHAGIPHGHTHLPGQGPLPGTMHNHAHCHPAGPDGSSATHYHPHAHQVPEEAS
jgi:hypothetical protein